ncbi:hypothetical protein Aduo_010163 [Ancylostoma duodenale]
MPRESNDHCDATLNSVECFDPRTSTWTSARPMNCKRSGLSLIANQGTLYAFGGFYGKDPVLTMKIYSESTNEWEIVDMPSVIANAGAVCIPMTIDMLCEEQN